MQNELQEGEPGSRKFNYELVGGKATEAGNVLGEGREDTKIPNEADIPDFLPMPTSCALLLQNSSIPG